MPAKVTDSEKKVRGTAQRCRARQVRPVRVIKREMRQLRRVISDMVFNVKLARKTIRVEGTLLEVLVTDSNGLFAKTRKLNPAFKIQMDAMTALKSLNRQMDFLTDELDAADAKQKKEEEFSEFRV